MLRVEGLNELRLAAAYFGRLDQPTRKALREEARRWSPMLVREAAVLASSQPAPAMALAKSGKITSTNAGLVATFGGTGFFNASGGRRVPVRRLVPFEFGAAQGKFEKYVSRQRTTKRAMIVRRRAQAQMRQRRPTGYFIFPAVADSTPTLVAMWVRAVAEVARGR